MKSAYELAMERLEKSGDTNEIQLTPAQKEQLADIDKRFAAKKAERKIFLEQTRNSARQRQDLQEVARIDEQIRREMDRISEDCEREKNQLREQARKS